MNAKLNAPIDQPLTVKTLGLRARFGKKIALDAVNLTVPEGSAFLLVGPNGAGKTTLLKTIVDLIRPESGEVSVFGLPAASEGARIRTEIGYVPEEHDAGYLSLSVRQVLSHHGEYFAAWDQDYAEELADSMDLSLEERLGAQSKGNARRVQLVQALAHRPRLLLLDEPTDGLDPLARDRFVSLLARHMAETPTTLLISTHLVHEVEGLADCMAVLDRGRLLAQVRRDDLDRHLHRYLMDVPEGWSGDPGLTLLQREDGPRQSAWTVWGEPRDVAARLSATGASVRETGSLSLEQATRVLLAMGER